MFHLTKKNKNNLFKINNKNKHFWCCYSLNKQNKILYFADKQFNLLRKIEYFH